MLNTEKNIAKILICIFSTEEWNEKDNGVDLLGNRNYTDTTDFLFNGHTAISNNVALLNQNNKPNHVDQVKRKQKETVGDIFK